MKALDLLAAVLVVIGGLNWGLVGLVNLDLVATLTGEMTAVSRAVYTVVGLSAVYQALTWKAIQRRWQHAPVRA